MKSWVGLQSSECGMCIRLSPSFSIPFFLSPPSLLASYWPSCFISPSFLSKFLTPSTFLSCLHHPFVLPCSPWSSFILYSHLSFLGHSLLFGSSLLLFICFPYPLLLVSPCSVAFSAFSPSFLPTLSSLLLAWSSITLSFSHSSPALPSFLFVSLFFFSTKTNTVLVKEVHDICMCSVHL